MGEAKATVFKEKDRFTIAPARTQCRRRLEDPGASRLVPAGLTNPIQVLGYTPRTGWSPKGSSDLARLTSANGHILATPQLDLNSHLACH